MPLDGCVVIEPELLTDDRGFFCRLYAEDEFRRRGLTPAVTETSLSFSRRKGTLRGLHFQQAPHAETKLVHCVRGSAFDVAVDLRPESTTYGRWASVVLSAENRVGIHIPEGMAHGFLTLEDDTELVYQISPGYHPEASAGVRWNDPELAIDWPGAPAVISERDRSLPLLANSR